MDVHPLINCIYRYWPKTWWFTKLHSIVLLSLALQAVEMHPADAHMEFTWGWSVYVRIFFGPKVPSHGVTPKFHGCFMVVSWLWNGPILKSSFIYYVMVQRSRMVQDLDDLGGTSMKISVFHGIWMGFNGWQPRMLKQHLPWQRDGDESHMVMWWGKWMIGWF